MSATQAPGPKLTNVGTRPVTPRKLFVNIPVNDLQRSIDFFEALGFTFNQQFTDATATAMLVGEDAYFMLLTKEKFATFSNRPLGDARKETNALFSLSADSRAEVDEIVKKASVAMSLTWSTGAQKRAATTVATTTTAAPGSSRRTRWA